MAQNALIKGDVTNTINKQNLPNTAVSLLRGKDSILVKFTRTDAKGAFELTNLAPGNYLLLVTYPHYAHHAVPMVLVDSSSVNDIGLAKLILKANLLK